MKKWNMASLAPLLFLILITHCSLLIAQIQFKWTIGGPGTDEARSIVQTTDGGYAAAGRTLSFGAGFNDFYIVKLDGSGTLQWSKTIGGANQDWAYSIIQTTDGGYAAAGYTLFGAGASDMFIVKLDGSGTIQWSKTIGGTVEDFANSIIQTTDGGYAVAGYTQSFGAGGIDMYIIKLDPGGMLQWSKTIGGTIEDRAYSIIQTTDGGYTIAGFTNSFGAGSGDIYIVKLNSSGTLQWSKTIGGTVEDFANSIIQTSEGGFAVAGSSGVYPNNDMYIVKLDGSGTLQWSKTIGGTGFDIANSIIQTTDGGFAVAGGTNSFAAGGADMFIVKLDGSGTLQWSRTIGGAGPEYGYSIIQTTDGGYAAAGYTSSFGAGSSDVYIVKLDGSGNTCGNFNSPTSQTGTGGTLGTPTPTVTTPSPAVTTPLPTTLSGGILTNICTFTNIQSISNEIPNKFELEQNYPNPFNPKTNIKYKISKMSKVTLSVFDVLGHEISVLVNEEQVAGNYEASWDASNYPSGVYYYQLTVSSEKLTVFTETKKMVLVK